MNKIRNLVVTITAIVVAIVGVQTYFAKASELTEQKKTLALHIAEFNSYKDYQRLEFLEKRILQYEYEFDCYGKECKNKMPLRLYEEYLDKLRQKENLERRLKLG